MTGWRAAIITAGAASLLAGACVAWSAIPLRPTGLAELALFLAVACAVLGVLRLVLASVVAPDEAFAVIWSLKDNKGNTIMAMPRAACYRGMVMNHMIHHRAQLGVYLRMLNVPLPGLYGPSADGPWQPAWPK